MKLPWFILLTALLNACGLQTFESKQVDGEAYDLKKAQLSKTNATKIDTTKTDTTKEKPSIKVNMHKVCEVNHPLYLSSLQNIWDAIRADFTFSQSVRHQRIDKYLDIFDRRRKYFNAISQQSEKYLFFIKQELKKRNMPSELALLPIIESAYDPFAYSQGQAAGLWQFIPSTAKSLNLKNNWWYEGRRDISQSTHAALDYLSSLHKLFNNDWLLALAAYNSGLGTVSRAIKKNKKLGLEYDYWSLNLPKETQEYVPKLIAIAQIISRPSNYDIELRYIPNTPYFDTVNIDGQIDLSQVAKLAETELTTIYQLNPGFNRWATDPHQNRPLLIPYNKRFITENNIAQLPLDQRLVWTRYIVKSGDTLGAIAQQYKIETSFLTRVNNLTTNTIVVGKSLLIPGPMNNSSSYQMSKEQRQQALAQSKKIGKKKISYRVRKNDSFWKIAKNHQVSVQALAKWNGMSPNDLLREKQILYIWIKEQNLDQRKIIRNIYYTVKAGDNLSNIASRFNVSVSDIKKWNSLANKKYLQPKQKLTLKVNLTK